MNNLVKFLRVNNLKQKELASYLGIAEGSVSKMMKGDIGYSKHLGKILSNDMDWDVTPLLEEPSSITANATNNSTAKVHIENTGSDSLAIAKTEIDSLKKEIDSLKAQLSEAKAEKEKYWDMIQKLMR